MGPLLLSRLSKLCLRKPPALVVRHLSGVRFLSETPLCQIVVAIPTSRDEDIGNLVICDYASSPCDIKVLEKTVPMYLMKETRTIGASHGWVATLKDGIVCLQDDLNPSASHSDPKRISLPPLVTLPHCQTQLVTNVAMSSSSPEDDDCIVAVKFEGPQLSLCRSPQKNPEWVNIRITDRGFFSSRVMYSKRDEMFSMPSAGGTRMGSWDLEKHRNKPKMQTWSLRNLPEFVQSDWERLDKCCTSEHLVESLPTGEMFMVKWFRQRNNDEGGRMEGRHMMVFKLDGNGNAFHTDDIGDLCIFLSKSEPFCLKASLYDLFKNCVYFVDNNERGIVDLVMNDEARSFSTYPAPYYIHPRS
ncbi:unnamed protein product [Arabidopsis halleri]